MVIGWLIMFLSLAFQPMVRAGPLLSTPARTSVSVTTGLVRSTSTQTCGASPDLGGSLLRPMPFFASSVKPYSPSSDTWMMYGGLVSVPVSSRFHVLPSRVYHNSTAETPDGPASFIL